MRIGGVERCDNDDGGDGEGGGGDGEGDGGDGVDGSGEDGDDIEDQMVAMVVAQWIEDLASLTVSDESTPLGV